jgi:hypothetical protein
MAENPIDTSVLDYKEPALTADRVEQTYDESFGLTPFNRWKNVGRIWYVPLTNISTSASVGDSFHSITVPEALDGTRIVGVEAAVVTTSASGGPILIQLARGATDLLTTRINIDDTEKSSLDATTQPVPNPDLVLRAKDQIDIDIDDIGDGAAYGWQLYIYLQ